MRSFLAFPFLSTTKARRHKGVQRYCVGNPSFVTLIPPALAAPKRQFCFYRGDAEEGIESLFKSGQHTLLLSLCLGAFVVSKSRTWLMNFGNYSDCCWFVRDQGEKAKLTHVSENFSTKLSDKSVVSWIVTEFVGFKEWALNNLWIRSAGFLFGIKAQKAWHSLAM